MPQLCFIEFILMDREMQVYFISKIKIVSGEFPGGPVVRTLLSTSNADHWINMFYISNLKLCIQFSD